MTRPHRYIRVLAAWMAMLLPVASVAVDTLRVLAWPGYADPDVVRAFEQRTKSRVELTVVGSDEVLWQKINHRDARDFDVFAVNTAELQRYIERGLVAPISTTALPNLARVLPRFRTPTAIPGLVRDGRVFAIPYAYAEMGLIYDRQQIGTAPDSISALWDARYRGKVLVYDGAAHNFSLAAQALGKPSVFQLREDDWPAVIDHLIALRRNVLTFYAQPDESVELFMGKRAALMLANYGSQQLQLLRAAGADVGYAIPREGALAWLDCWAIVRGTPNTLLAEAWINYLLEEEPGKVLVARHGLSNTTTPSPYLGPNDRLIWLDPVEDAERRTQLWQRIISGDRASRILVP
jgi:putative spermidine/putrescine transport system substrate-binding protein